MSTTEELWKNKVNYNVNDTVKYVSREPYAFVSYGDIGVVISLQEGIFDIPYAIVKFPDGRTVVAHYYRFQKVEAEQ